MTTRRMLLFIVLLPAVAAAQDASGPLSPAANDRLVELRTSQFILRTDLPAPEARQRLERMEDVLSLAADYWGRQPRGQFACYLVDNLENWKDDDLPHPLARVWIRGVQGVTMSRRVPYGHAHHSESVIYASSRVGVAEHEVVHAYCCQTFGSTGPDWYKEGMAEMISSRVHSRSHAACFPAVARLRRRAGYRSIQQVLASGKNTTSVLRTCERLLRKRGNATGPVSADAWTSENDKTIDDIRQEYVWSWALCHFLCHNANYASRFRQLGDTYLSHGKTSFDDLFSRHAAQLEFEFRFFLEHARAGYRVDLCRWEWDRPFRSLAASGRVGCRIDAARGYQASGLTVDGGERYCFGTRGKWSTSTHAPACSARGDGRGQGKLVGALLSGTKLSAPFSLGESGSFVAPGSGNLYLRCQDQWHELADNHGSIQVTLSRASSDAKRPADRERNDGTQ